MNDTSTHAVISTVGTQNLLKLGAHEYDAAYLQCANSQRATAARRCM
jgi:hypothetical protein